MIRRKIPFTSQPQSPVGIDWGDPITRGLVFASAGDTDAVKNSLLSGTAGRGVSRYGGTRTFDGSTTGLSSLRSLPVPVAYTLVALAYPTNQTATNTLVSIGTGVSGKYVVLDLSGTETNDPLRIVYNGTAAGSAYYINPPYNTWSLFGGIASPGGTNKLYLNGARLTPSSSSSGGNIPVGTEIGVGQLTQDTTSNRLTGNIAFSAAWDRELSDAEMRSLYLSPWQIFAPQTRNIFVSVAGGGLDISGTLGTATASGLTANVDRQLAITGTLATATATGLTANIDSQLAIAGLLGTATADGLTANVDKQLSAAALLGTATADGITAIVSNGMNISATLATATASGFNASIDQQIAISGSLATATASGLTANINRQLAVSALLGTATASGFDASISAVTYGNTYNAAGYFTTGGTVTILLYDPVTGIAISLSSNACPEIGTTGVYIWDTTKLTTQPTGYQEYVYKMSDGTTFSGGMITMAITAQAIATAVWAETLDVITAEQTMKVVLSALAGKRAGIGTATETYYDSAGTAAVITFAPDARGNGIPTVTP